VGEKEGVLKKITGVSFFEFKKNLLLTLKNLVDRNK
jgi:hypothetical protein